jgi:hypothetical protein
MLKRGITTGLNSLKSLRSFGLLKLTPSFSFSTKTEAIVNILKSEISHEESNYQPVDKNELDQFFKNTSFQFVDKENSLNLELKKVHGNYEVIVNFQAKPPVPQEESQEGQEKDGEKSKYFK